MILDLEKKFHDEGTKPRRNTLTAEIIEDTQGEKNFGQNFPVRLW
jgi:hypothetical protein